MTTMIKTPASLEKRFVANLIDIGILLIFNVILLLTVKNFRHVLLIQLLFNVLYFVGFEGSGWHATPGKKVLGCTIEKCDGQPLSFSRALFRYLCPIFFYMSYLASLCQIFIIIVSISDIITFMHNEHSTFKSFLSSIKYADMPPHIVGIILAGILLFMIEIPILLFALPAFFTKDNRLIHDWMSNTKVMQPSMKK